MNNDHDDLPIIQCPPAPTDAELQTERDTKHAAAVREWFARPEPPYLDDPNELLSQNELLAQNTQSPHLDHIPARAVQI